MAYPSWLNRGMLNEQVQTAQQLCNGAGLDPSQGVSTRYVDRNRISHPGGVSRFEAQNSGFRVCKHGTGTRKSATPSSTEAAMGRHLAQWVAANSCPSFTNVTCGRRDSCRENVLPSRQPLRTECEHAPRPLPQQCQKGSIYDVCHQSKPPPTSFRHCAKPSLGKEDEM